MAILQLTSAKTEERLVNLLALIAGYVDAYGYLTFSTYLSFMSGNTTQTGYNIGGFQIAEAMPTLTAILLFVAGVIIGTLFSHSSKYERRKRLLFAFIASLLASTIVIFELGYANAFVHIAINSFAMGIMNTTIRQIGPQPVSLTFVTGTLNRIARHIALGIKGIPLQDSQGPWDTQFCRARKLVKVWIAFISGAILSGVATPHIHAWVLLFPILLLLLVGCMQFR